MKKKYLLLAAAALTLAACSNDENLNDGPVAIRLSSGIEVQEVPRAATGIQSDAFDANEQVDVFITEASENPTTTYPQPLIYTTGANNAMTPPAGGQPYFPASGYDVNIYAYYPSKAVTDMSATDVLFTIQTDQSTEENYKASDLMFGKPATNPVRRTDNAIPLTFTHLLSKVTIELRAGAGSPDLDGAAVRLLYVMPSTTLNASTGTIGAASGTPIRITVSKDALSGSAIIVPQELLQDFIEVDLADGGVLYGSLKDSSQPNLVGGNAYTYTITVNLTGLDISASINPWIENDGVEGSAEM